MNQLNAREQRIFDELSHMVSQQSKSNPSTVLITSYQQVAAASCCGTTTVKEAIKSMQEKGVLQRLPRAFGGGMRVRLLNQLHDASGRPIGSTSRPVESIGRLIDAHEFKEESTNSINSEEEEEEARTRKILDSLLYEHGMKVQFRNILISNELLPGIRGGRTTLDELRTECHRTRGESQSWRFPERMLYARLKRLAAGELAPLSLVPSGAAASTIGDPPPARPSAKPPASDTRAVLDF